MLYNEVSGDETNVVVVIAVTFFGENVVASGGGFYLCVFFFCTSFESGGGDTLVSNVRKIKRTLFSVVAHWSDVAVAKASQTINVDTSHTCRRTLF
jgi:hypothetical protein